MTKNREKFMGQRVIHGTFLKSERITKAILENLEAASKYTFLQICKFLTTFANM